MEGRCGQAVCYESDQGEAWALVENENGETLICKELLQSQDLAQRWSGLEAGKYTGRMEVFISNREVKVLRRQVKRTTQLSDIRTYAKVREGFVWRRRVKSENGQLDPPFLYPICMCREPLNPDFLYVCCESCQSLFHEQCLSNMECPQCKASLGGIKRQGSFVEEDLQKHPSLQLERKPSQVLQVTKYPLMPQAAAELTAALNRLAEEAQHLQFILGEEDKVRQNLKDKVLGALLLAQAEQRSQGEESFQDLKALQAISIEAEAALYFSSSQTVKSPNYGRRARMIIFNLLDEKNCDLRANLLRGSVVPKKLAFMESKDMASVSMKQLREERERKYLEEQLICPNTGAKLLVKTHKGEGVIDMGEDRVLNSDTTDLLETLQEHKHAPMHEDEEDPFDPNNHSSSSVAEEVPPPAHSPYILTRVYEVVKDNTPQLLAQKIRKRMMQYLKPEQVEGIMKAIK